MNESNEIKRLSAEAVHLNKLVKLLSERMDVNSDRIKTLSETMNIHLDTMKTMSERITAANKRIDAMRNKLDANT